MDIFMCMRQVREVACIGMHAWIKHGVLSGYPFTEHSVANREFE